jgi:hypothetical protein
MNAAQRNETYDMFHYFPDDERFDLYEQLLEYLDVNDEDLLNEVGPMFIDSHYLFFSNAMTTRSTEPEFKDLDQILFELIKRGLSLQKALDLLRAIRTVMGPFNVQLPAQSERVPYQHYIDEDEPPRALGELTDFEITVVLGLPPPRARAFQPPFQLVPPPQIRRRAAAAAPAAPPPHNGNIDLSMNATNAITLEPLEFPQEMVNFHGERALGRYYTQNTFDRFIPNATGRKQNPFTRRPILNSNIRRYRATPAPAAPAAQGGRRKKTQRRKTPRRTSSRKAKSRGTSRRA